MYMYTVKGSSGEQGDIIHIYICVYIYICIYIYICGLGFFGEEVDIIPRNPYFEYSLIPCQAQ